MKSRATGLDKAIGILRDHGHTIGDTVIDADGVVKTSVDDTFLTPGEIRDLARVKLPPVEAP